ncbi:DUF2332 domain-containing protein [Clavibacter sp. Sh2036]|uniref:DUF2332 domain-containing protein n=1 Tax=Clavibacter sp. Sh2036 TaxID=3397677 RepID=UPI0039E18848
MTEDAVAHLYRRFAEVEARGVSDVYDDWASGVAEDDGVLALIAALPAGKRQPNLVFAAARLVGAPVGPYRAFREWLVGRWSEVEPVIRSRSTQTNEAARCAVLLPVLSALEGPLALIEVGASAGLCLQPDRYGYRYATPDGVVALDPDAGPSPMTIPCSIDAASVPTRLPNVVWRAGIDLNPLDARDPETREWLRALVWPEHGGRRARLDAALRITAADPPRLARGDLLERIPQLVAEAPAGAHVVVFHSSVLSYVDPDARQRFAAIMRACTRATWVSNEGERVLPRVAERLDRPARGRTVLAVDERPVALVGPHGQSYEAL